MALRKWYVGDLGAFFYDDTKSFVRIETATGTTEISIDSLAGQPSDDVGITGGQIDAVAIGTNSPASVVKARHIVLTTSNGTEQIDLMEARTITTGISSPSADVVAVISTSLGYIRIYDTI